MSDRPDGSPYPPHLQPLDAGKVHALCDEIALAMPDRHSVLWLELVAARDTRTPHDPRRLARALEHVALRQDLAAKVQGLLEGEP
jgi:hypothetical protein